MSPGRDQRWMAEALRAARRGLYSTPPNPCVGCVIVHDDRLLATGWHEYAGGPHAEVNAIDAGEVPPGAEFYVSLEPCSHHGRTPPCVDALIACRPARVVAAMVDPNPEIGGRGLELLRAQGIEVVCGVLEAEARALNRGFVKRMERGRPFVSVKMACSLDGKSALANGVSQWITGEAARRDVQFLRARASAILSSARTVLADDPSLDLRLDAGTLGQLRAPRQPVRVIVDARLDLGGDEKIFARGGDVLLYTLSDDAARRARLEDRGATVIRQDRAGDGRIDLAAMLDDLARRGVNEVHTECGAVLAGALIRECHADQIVLYFAPHLLGSAARGGFDLGEIRDMAARRDVGILDNRQVGDDIRLTLSVE